MGFGVGVFVTNEQCLQETPIEFRYYVCLYFDGHSNNHELIGDCLSSFKIYE